jgi:ankyrin repeat protein
MYKTVEWIGEGPHLLLQKEIVRSGFDASEVEAPSFSKWPMPCSPDWSSEAFTPDPFYVDWISMNIGISPGGVIMQSITMIDLISAGFAGLNPLLEAILIGSQEEVSKCLTGAYITDKTNLLGQSPLHLAIHRPQHLRAVLDAGAEVNTGDRHGITPLMYAAAIGNTDATILLLESGADPSTRDKLWRRNFMNYAVTRGHWETIMRATNHICASTKYSDKDAWLWLGWALVMWATDRGLWGREPKTLQTLLEWGAPLNITFRSDSDTGGDTILHHIQKLDELEILVRGGFNKFNHPNSRGVYPLFAIAERLNPDLLRICLDNGSLVNQQNRSGRSVLHMTSRALQTQLPSPQNHFGDHSPWVDDGCEKRTKELACMTLLLESEADPVLGDYCLCACSRSGCNPSTAILKHSLWHRAIGSNCETDVWTLEWLSTVHQYRGYEVARQCLLDLIRWTKFEELELTHTCHCDLEDDDILSILLRRKPVDHDDLHEIRDEEKIMIEELEEQMEELNSLEIEDLEDFWIQTLAHFDHIQKAKHAEECSKTPRNNQSQVSKLGQSVLTSILMRCS